MEHRKLSDELGALLQTDGDALTVEQLVDRVGDRGFGLLLLVLSLPSALPVPAAGYSIPFGLLLLVLSVQMLIGKSHPVFPARLKRVRISSGFAEKLIKGAAWIFKRLEWVIRPRMRWVGLRGGRMLMGFLVLAMAILMMIPIPMTNTFPAFVIFLIGIGLTEDDGLFAIGACVVGILAVLLYAALIWAIIVHGPEVATTIKDSIKSMLP
ncbi:exopolysaccharide biosynthesis protein [Puniceicoccales bacterium CK1056]|uniref:Exopolysaccharide biosynthesis protein n=1 Tax=Oceanipulchritudo coccoides TaxID=2706888 RepID=A0A6B2LYB1_9BACT|nr:exopolysaccharide biosynthesis protein [Oceanipulchritudo coccoides]NDV61066.1 exopolysaccharide biosynthesis protein [Oceanipulchritudo coccoides]